jgi:hypothetical protein
MSQEKYTIPQLELYLTRGEIDPLLWMAHFPDTLDSKVPVCEECTEFKAEFCPGGKHPVDCFLSRT